MYDVCLVAQRDHDWLNQWSYVLTSFPAVNIFCIDQGNVISLRNYRPLDLATRILTVDELPNSKPLIAFQPENARFFPGTENILSFVHPSECIYIFGNDHTHLSADELGTRIPDSIVYIPTATNDELFSFVAGGIALYDRIAKRG